MIKLLLTWLFVIVEMVVFISINDIFNVWVLLACLLMIKG